MADPVAQQYRRNDAAFKQRQFPRAGRQPSRVWPAHLEDRAGVCPSSGRNWESITEFDPLTGAKTDTFEKIRVYANSHYVTPRPTMQQAMKGIKEELRQRLDQLVGEGKLLEAQRLEQRTNFDLEMLGSHRRLQRDRELFPLSHRPRPPANRRHAFRIHPRQRHRLRRRKPRHRAPDRRHVSRRLPAQVHAGRARVPLPSCMDNRPLKFEEWDAMRPQSVFVSATPAAWEWNRPAASSPNR